MCPTAKAILKDGLTMQSVFLSRTKPKNSSLTTNRDAAPAVAIVAYFCGKEHLCSRREKEGGKETSVEENVCV